jgi:hypothetical protein
VTSTSAVVRASIMIYDSGNKQEILSIIISISSILGHIKEGKDYGSRGQK